MLTIKEDEFRQFADYIKANYGIHFKKEKKTLIEGRLGNLLASLNFKSLTEYMDYVKADKTGQAATGMLDKITTNHTFFMREPAHFKYFRDTALPWLHQTARNKDIRIWSAACSSGEHGRCGFISLVVSAPVMAAVMISLLMFSGYLSG